MPIRGPACVCLHKWGPKNRGPSCTRVHTRQCEDLHVYALSTVDRKTEDSRAHTSMRGPRMCVPYRWALKITWRHLHRGPQSRKFTMGVVTCKTAISHDLWNCDGLRYFVIGGGDNIIVQCAFSTFYLDSMTFIYGIDRIPWRYTRCANINFLHQDFRKLSSDRHTYMQTNRNYIPGRFAGGQRAM